MELLSEMVELWHVTRSNYDYIVKELINLFFSQPLSDECRHGILRYCAKTSGDERSSIVELFHKNIKTMSSREDIGFLIDRTSDVLHFLASDPNFGLFLMAECSNPILDLYSRILSYFLQCSWVKREAALRLTIQSLLAFVKCHWKEAAKKAERMSGLVARSVRRLMMRDLPTNVMMDCGVIVVEIDLRRNRLTSSLWLLKNCETVESITFIALCYGALSVSSPRFFSKITQCEENAVKSEPLVPLLLIMRSASGSRKNDGRYLLAVFKLFEIFTRKIRFVELNFDSHFFEFLVQFLWKHCDHFADAIRTLSRQCLKNALLQSDQKIINEIRKILMKTKVADERLCYMIVNSCCTELADDDCFSNHCYHLITCQLEKMDSSLSISWMTRAYITLLKNAYRGEFDFWFERWIRPIWELSVEPTSSFQRDVMVAAITVCPQSLEILIDMASKEQLSSILDYILSIEDEEVRRKRMIRIEPHILINLAQSNPLAVVTLISERKDQKSCTESLQASVDAIFYCNRDYERRIFVHKIKNIAMDEDDATWIQQRCFSNLFAGASFDRRHCALLLLGALSQPLQNCSFDNFRALFTCLGDSYAENQSLAFQLLKPIVGNLCEGNQLRPIYTFLIEAIFEANVSEHDTCAFVSQLLCYLPADGFDLLEEYAQLLNLKQDLRDVKKNGGSFHVHLTFLLEIVKSRLEKFDSSPLYGVLRVIRHIVEHTQFNLQKTELLSELAKTCVECNLQVLSIVSQSSPEGFLPSNELTELDVTNESLLYMNSQKALLRGWRTVKEASLLLKHLLSVEQFDESLMKFIGAHIKTLLFELKHKGAIEVVYVAASTYCYVCGRSTNEYIRDLPRRWLQEIIELIMNGNESPICRWRRSAGIPFIVQAVLSANSIQSDILCHQLAEQLLQIYNDNDRAEESKIHSANVLRILFKNKNLAQKVDNHVETTLKFAIDGVASSSWNIRNVSWLLLGSVIPRSLELNNNGPNAIHFFRQFPSLFDFFCQRLRGCDRSQLKNQSSVFAVLLILASLQPPNECDFGDGTHNSLLTLLLPIVYECGGSPIWKIRITAARAIRALVPRHSYVSFISGICAIVKLPLQQNCLHGSLLQVETLLRLDWTMSLEEKYHLRKILIDFVADTNSVLMSDENCVPVKRQIFILHTLIHKKLIEWKLDDDDVFASSAAAQWPTKSVRAPTSLDNGTFIQSWMIHHVTRQLRRTSDLLQFEEILKYACCQPVVAITMLEIFLQPTSSYLEADNSVHLLRDYFLSLNTIDQNRIISFITQSQFSCRLLNAYVRTCVAEKTYPFRGIRILSYLVDSKFFEVLTIDEIESMCSLVGADEEAFSAIINYLTQVSRFLVIHSQNDLLRILRSVCTLDPILVDSHSREQLIVLYDDFLLRTRGSDDVSTILNVWSQKLAFAACEKPSSLDAFLRDFYLDTSKLYEPSVCAVALVGWSLAKIGLIWDRIESQGASSAFSENLPTHFENRIILSRICSKLLRELLHLHAELPDSILDSRLTLWLCSHCNISSAESISKLVDVVSFFREIRDNLATSFNDCLASYLYHGTVFKCFAMDSINLVISAFENS